MAILQVLSVALVCMTVQAAPPSWANGGPPGAGAHNNPMVAALIKERIEQFKAGNGPHAGPHPSGGSPAWAQGHPLFFNYTSHGRPQNQQAVPKPVAAADQKPQKPARFGPPVINFINSPQEGGAQPIPSS